MYDLPAGITDCRVADVNKYLNGRGSAKTGDTRPCMLCRAHESLSRTSPFTSWLHVRVVVIDEGWGRITIWVGR